MRTARDVLRERGALSRLRVAARAYAAAIRRAETSVALVSIESDMVETDERKEQLRRYQRDAREATKASQAAAERLEAAALRFSDASPARRKRGRR